ncbi:LysR family transcriptional regulator [Paraburkholderia madseniana]|uniref:MFS transporter n=1 Tax=Paraburkholderia madseniana TaxID=2599607 RepID=UPI001A01229E|nr:MFS transporter [Paraburkholderia madseniana]NPT68112.1 LysR family transcriptional regulator [Paraburkholderia madseniana]
MADIVSSMRIFARVVETGSFTAVAKENNVTAAQVSRAVTALEQQLQTVVLHRTTRHLSVTEPGGRFYERAKAILAAVDSATDETRSADFAAAETRGRVVGTIMSGLVLGILLSRPISSFIAAQFGWRAVFGFGAVVMTLVTVLLALTLPGLGVFGLVGTGVLLDFAVQMNLVLGQREIYLLDPKSRNRLNSIYMTSVFVGGAAGSAIASTLYRHGGWTWVAVVGMLFPLLALSRFLFAGKPAQ